MATKAEQALLDAQELLANNKANVVINDGYGALDYVTDDREETSFTLKAKLVNISLNYNRRQEVYEFDISAQNDQAKQMLKDYVEKQSLVKQGFKLISKSVTLADGTTAVINTVYVNAKANNPRNIDEVGTKCELTLFIRANKATSVRTDSVGTVIAEVGDITSYSLMHRLTAIEKAHAFETRSKQMSDERKMGREASLANRLGVDAQNLAFIRKSMFGA